LRKFHNFTNSNLRMSALSLLVACVALLLHCLWPMQLRTCAFSTLWTSAPEASPDLRTSPPALFVFAHLLTCTVSCSAYLHTCVVCDLCTSATALLAAPRISTPGASSDLRTFTTTMFVLYTPTHLHCQLLHAPLHVGCLLICAPSHL